MIQFDDFSAFSDLEGMLVHKEGVEGAFSKMAHNGDTDPGHYSEVPRSDEEARKRAERVAERYRELAAQKIRSRYSESEEYAIQRKALAAVMGAAEVMGAGLWTGEMEETEVLDGGILSDGSTGGNGAEALSLADPEKALEEFAEYNRYAEACKREARAEAEAALTGEMEGMEGF